MRVILGLTAPWVKTLNRLSIPYALDKLLEVLKQAYEARLKKKFEFDQVRIQKIANLATGSSAIAILRELRKLDDEVK